ncbi:alpha-amylase family protein [uncultured Gemmiger sp.]|uniref:alpha-amylase family protein n=1 Tax=uncultured Gemmiger sp. TaxID=1623490 RepID=UPI0025D52EB0|nr:alpha-amylase family protein [uncultured Gemmiger sp.]
MTKQEESRFQARLARHHDELRWLYMELYDNGSMFAELCDQLHRFADERRPVLKKRDAAREAEPDWYKHRDLLGSMLYIDNFAGNLNGVRKKLDYLESAGVDCIHLMPFLDTVPGRSDGGYAVADFRTVRPDLGTMDDLQKLTDACHRKNINVCMDFVMNHTSCDHQWARRARAGDGEYMSRYFFYDNPSIPAEYEKTVPQVFPTTAPGNFTYFEDCGYWVMTTFYPYQWDLNYHNPRVFNEMMYNFLFLANQGMDIIRIDAVPYIWKELGTSCRNLDKVHTIVRMMRMIGEIVCPSVILLGEVVMEPVKVVPYFGTVDKPECHLLYNVTTMCTTWHTVATRDTRLLRGQLDSVAGLPKQYLFLNYLRCHDDIGWGLDYPTLRQWGMEEVPHKKYLNEFFLGHTPGSVSRGELYNDDPTTGDARFCGTTASMCGLETARTDEERALAVRKDLMLHAMMLFQSGIPMLYSGDEIGQLNDYSYKDDPARAGDSRYIHRGKLPWDRAAQRSDLSTPAGQIFSGLHELESLRREHVAFEASADVWTLDTGDISVLGIGRYYDGEMLAGLFNFDTAPKTIPLPDGTWRDLHSGAEYSGSAPLEPCGYLWLLHL